MVSLQGQLLLLYDGLANGEGFAQLAGPRWTGSYQKRSEFPASSALNWAPATPKRSGRELWMLKDEHMFRRMEQKFLELTRSYLPSRSYPFLAGQTILARLSAKHHICSHTPKPAASYRFAEASRFQTGVRAMAGRRSLLPR